jgi:membrane protease YdiL (CAAX protease family)
MNWIKKNPVLSYFIFTFLISWGAILILIAINGMPNTVAEAQAQLPLAIMTFLLGPFLTGLMMIGLVHGRNGYRDLWSRMIKWRINLVWYAIALLLAPLVFVATHFFLSLFSPVYLPGFLTVPDGSTLILMGIISGIMVGILEEVGWFGFAIPEMRKRYSPLAVGLIVGIIWGAWHIMANDIWAIKTYSGEIPTVHYAILSGLSFLIGQLPPFRILMVWAYERTGSLFLMVVMHFSLTACSITFSPTAMTGWEVFIYSLAVAAVFWVIAAAVVLADRRTKYISTVQFGSTRTVSGELSTGGSGDGL